MTEPAIEVEEVATPVETVETVEPSEPSAAEIVDDVMSFEDLGDEDEQVPETEATETTTEVEKEEVFKTPEEVLAEAKGEEKVEVKTTEPEPEKEEVITEVKTEPVEVPVEIKTEPVVPSKTPEELRTELKTQIAENYQLTEEQVTELQMHPETFFPKMGADMYVDIYETTYYSIMNQIPQMIQAIMQQNTVTNKNEGAFYEAFPELNKPEYVKQVPLVAEFWKKQNPSATTEQAIQGIGTTAMALLQITRAAPTEEVKPLAIKPEPILPSTPAGAKAAGAGSETEEVNEILAIFDHEDPDS